MQFYGFKPGGLYKIAYQKFDSPTLSQWIEGHLSGDYLGYTYLRTRTALLRPSVPITGTLNWSKWSYEAVREMSPKFSDLSLVNDLLELRQIKDLAAPFGKAKSLIGKASSATLWWQFGVKPTAQSVEGVIKLLRDLPAAIAKLRQRGSRLQTRHYRKYLDLTGALPNDVDSLIEAGGSST
jgi:hypothetical protein